MKNNEVVIVIEKGMPNIVKVPEGVTARVVDFDIIDLDGTKEYEGRPAYVQEVDGPYEDL